MKNIVLFICILLGTWQATIAQNFVEASGTRRFINDLYLLDEYIKRQDKFVDYTDTDSYLGTPYYKPKYHIGNVYQNKTLLAQNVALRYNAIADEIEVKETIETPIADARPLPKSPEIFVKIDGVIFVFAAYKGGIEGGGYFQVLYEGDKIDVFKKLHKKFYPSKPAKTSITRATKAKFVDKPVYYLVSKNGKFYELPSSKKRKLDVFGKNRDVIEDYVTKKRLDLNKEQDLIATVVFFNSLNDIRL